MKDRQDLTINTNKKTFFRQYVELLQPFISIRKREADVFSELLYQCYLRKDIRSIDDRFKIVFNTETKVEIQEKLGISSPVLRNAISQLRKSKLIVSGNKIPKQYLVEPDKEFSLQFKFLIKND